MFLWGAIRREREFDDVLKQMEERQLTGDSMRGMVQDLCDRSKMQEWNDWYRRILIKDLRCGVTHKTINKHSTMKVPVFECMLADDSKKHEKKMTGEVIVEPKLDGVRVITICDVDKDVFKKIILLKCARIAESPGLVGSNFFRNVVMSY